MPLDALPEETGVDQGRGRKKVEANYSDVYQSVREVLPSLIGAGRKPKQIDSKGTNYDVGDATKLSSFRCIQG